MVIHVMPKSMAMTNSGRGTLSDIAKVREAHKYRREDRRQIKGR